jgi:hypothetical protein
MNEPLELSDAAIEAMLMRRARRADPSDLAEIALDAVRQTPARSGRPWDGLAASPRLASGSARWLWVAIAAILALALVGGLLGVGVSRLLQRPYPLLTGNPGLSWMSRAVSGDELWTMGDGEGLWHYVGDAWQGPLSPPPLAGEMVSGFALGPDGALWVAGEATVAVLREGAWSVAWRDASGAPLAGLVVAPDGTVWLAQGRELVGLRREAAGYSARTVACPRVINRIAAATDGTVYVGGFWYAGGEGLARSDGMACDLVDPLGDGQVHEVSNLSAGPGGSLIATVFDEDSSGCPCHVWMVMLQDGRWSTISGPTVEPSVSLGQAIAPDGHPWRIDSDLGLEWYEGGVWRVVAASARSLAMAPDGVLWYETDRGIERIRTDEVGG